VLGRLLARTHFSSVWLASVAKSPSTAVLDEQPCAALCQAGTAAPAGAAGPQTNSAESNGDLNLVVIKVRIPIGKACVKGIAPQPVS
jgi:hypothetical protein